MTDRIHTLTLEEGNSDSKSTIEAIRMIRGVRSIEPRVIDPPFDSVAVHTFIYALMKLTSQPVGVTEAIKALRDMTDV